MDEPRNPARQSVSRPTAPLAGCVLAIVALVGFAAYAQHLRQERLGLRKEIAHQEHQLLDLRERLTRAEVALQERNAALASRDVALAEATQPNLPVRVAFRPAWMGQGMVASFLNVADHQLTLMVEFRDPSRHLSRDFAFVIEGGGSTEVGHAQGWLVTSGQSVHVAASGYKSITAFAP